MAGTAEAPRHKNELSVEECVAKATRYVASRGMCLFLMDAVGSRRLTVADHCRFLDRLSVAMHDMNERFITYFPINKLATPSRIETGFTASLGDGTWAGINSPEVIPQIASYMKEHFPDIRFRYGIARDGYDGKATALVR